MTDVADSSARPLVRSSAGATLSDQRASLSAMILECFVMVGMNIDNFVTDMAFIADVRKEYDLLRHKMGIPHSSDVPEDEAEEEDTPECRIYQSCPEKAKFSDDDRIIPGSAPCASFKKCSPLSLAAPQCSGLLLSVLSEPPTQHSCPAFQRSPMVSS